MTRGLDPDINIDIDWAPQRTAFDAATAAGPAPLEQGWAYGTALADVSRIAVRRGILRSDDTAVGTVQAAERGLAGGFRLVRLTRGPVTAAEDETATAAARAIRAVYPARSRHLLFWMPDLPPDGDTRRLMRRLGKRPMTTGYTTAWLDLSPGIDAVRAGLRGNWRNALSGAEASALEVRSDGDAAALESFLAGYRADRRAKRYAGPGDRLLRSIADAFEADLALLVARLNGKPVAAALFLRHGTSATYYLAWTTDDGRATNAGHLLLWRGVAAMHAAGVRWLDLGGVDARAPGIARFKLGLGAAPQTRSGLWF